MSRSLDITDSFTGVRQNLRFQRRTSRPPRDTTRWRQMEHGKRGAQHEQESQQTERRFEVVVQVKYLYNCLAPAVLNLRSL
jgi:hypothetical protein